MKNFVKLFGIMALVAVIGFSMIACDDDDSGDGIVGTWVGSTTIEGAAATVTVVVKSGGTGTITYAIPSYSYSETESFTWSQSGSTVTVTVEDEDDENYSFDITYSGGNKFTFDGIEFTRK